MEYFNIQLPSLKEDLIESTYLTLLENKYSFAILSVQEKNYLLTKERSIMPINNLHLFLKEREKDCYFKTIGIKKKNLENIQEKVKLFHDYYHKYEAFFHKLYGGKYRFGCIAIRINEHSFLTTIREKKILQNTQL